MRQWSQCCGGSVSNEGFNHYCNKCGVYCEITYNDPQNKVNFLKDLSVLLEKYNVNIETESEHDDTSGAYVSFEITGQYDEKKGPKRTDERIAEFWYQVTSEDVKETLTKLECNLR